MNLRSTLSTLLLTLCACGNALATDEAPTSLLGQMGQHLSDVWTQGSDDLYVPFHTYHMRYAYSAEKINSFREDTWGLGYGRSRYDSSGNWSGLYGMTFLDSHSKLEPIVGYGQTWMLGNPQDWHAGIGYTAFITARADIGHYTPIPGILPIASVNYKQASLNTTYMPGGTGHGNILFFWTRFGF
jgi:palmitoyl transferase